MQNNKDQTVKKNDETATSTKEKTQETFAATNRPNIDVITARNEEEVARDRKSLYINTGIVALLVLVIIIVIYFLI